MQPLRTLILAGLVFLLSGVITVPVAAQSSEGDREIAFSASFFKLTQSGAGDGTLIANARYGQFLTDRWQVGGGLQISGEIDDLDKAVSFELFAGYFFSPGETNTWYVRGGYFASLDDPGKGFADAAGGYKSYFTEKIAFFWEAGYGTAIDSDAGDGVIRSLAGITYTF